VNTYAGIRFGALGAGTLHLCVDMQMMFAEPTDWQVPWMRRVLPAIVRLADAHKEATVFTRFIPPRRPEQMPGVWQRYYQSWPDMLSGRIDPGLLELLPELRVLTPPATVLDKHFYSPFTEPALAGLLQERGIDALVVSGGETDVCVLATVLDAVDRGVRVVLATDALCSTSDEAHDCLLSLYRNRYSQQIEAASVEQILSAWR
jgi:nicotinamidase-related amidase